MRHEELYCNTILHAAYIDPVLILSPNLIRLTISPRLYLVLGEDPKCCRRIRYSRNLDT